MIPEVWDVGPKLEEISMIDVFIGKSNPMDEEQISVGGQSGSSSHPSGKKYAKINILIRVKTSYYKPVTTVVNSFML